MFLKQPYFAPFFQRPSCLPGMGRPKGLPWHILPETNSKGPWKWAVYPQKETRKVFQPSIFGCELLVSGRVSKSTKGGVLIAQEEYKLYQSSTTN